MSRFPSPTLAERIDDRVRELDDGFVRLGDEDTPFLLREGGETRERAQRIHDNRDGDERRRDEETNEPVTRAIEEWTAAMTERDFPLVDTIPPVEHRDRADEIADLARREDLVDEIALGVAFEDETVRGKYWSGVDLIEVGTDADDFPGYRSGAVLAHELGRAFYDAWSPESGVEIQSDILLTTDEREQARRLSERLHGPMIDADGPFVDYRLEDDGELVAAVFASRIVEPEAAQRIAPDAVRRVDDVLGDLSENLF